MDIYFQIQIIRNSTLLKIQKAKDQSLKPLNPKPNSHRGARGSPRDSGEAKGGPEGAMGPRGAMRNQDQGCQGEPGEAKGQAGRNLGQSGGLRGSLEEA